MLSITYNTSSASAAAEVDPTDVAAAFVDPVTVDGIPLNEAMAKKMKKKKAGTTGGKAFVLMEDLLMIYKAWVNASEEPVVGTSPKGKDFIEIEMKQFRGQEQRSDSQNLPTQPSQHSNLTENKNHA